VSKGHEVLSYQQIRKIPFDCGESRMYGRSLLKPSTLKRALEVEDVYAGDVIDNCNLWEGQANADWEGTWGRLDLEGLRHRVKLGDYHSFAT
jgi:hypothetical protein